MNKVILVVPAVTEFYRHIFFSVSIVAVVLTVFIVVFAFAEILLLF